MATIQEITQRIAAANAEVKRLNNERNVNLGKKETLTTQLNNTLTKYAQQYGVQLTVDNLAQEMNRVLEEKEKETANIESMLSLIKEGKYEEAEHIANPDAEYTQATVEPTPTPVAQTATATVTPTPVTPVAPTPVTPTPVASTPVAPTPVAPTPNVLPNLSDTLPNLSDTVEQKPKTVLPDLSEEVGIDALKGFQSGEPAPIAPKETVVKESAGAMPDLTGVTDFEAILGGEAFKA